MRDAGTANGCLFRFRHYHKALRPGSHQPRCYSIGRRLRRALRAEITAPEMNRSITAFEQDIATGRWQRPAYTIAAVEQRAEELSAGHSAALGCRTLAIIEIKQYVLRRIGEARPPGGLSGAVPSLFASLAPFRGLFHPGC